MPNPLPVNCVFDIGDAVDDEQRLVLAEDRARAANHDALRAAHVAGLADLQARHLAGQRADEGRRLNARELFSRHRLLRRADRRLLSLLAQRRDDDTGELRGRRRENEVLRDRRAVQDDAD